MSGNECSGLVNVAMIRRPSVTRRGLSSAFYYLLFINILSLKNACFTVEYCVRGECVWHIPRIPLQVTHEAPRNPSSRCAFFSSEVDQFFFLHLFFHPWWCCHRRAENMAEDIKAKLENYRTAPFDARFPNQNQTRNCWSNYLGKTASQGHRTFHTFRTRRSETKTWIHDKTTARRIFLWNTETVEAALHNIALLFARDSWRYCPLQTQLRSVDPWTLGWTWFLDTFNRSCCFPNRLPPLPEGSGCQRSRHNPVWLVPTGLQIALPHVLGLFFYF